jgi:DNA-binding HxlR family transcriptional regulator
MNSWIRKITDKSSGEDRSAWVVSYESERYEMDRVGAGSIHAENMAVSIYGNIQPQVFKQNVKALSADGLLQRFVPAILRASKTRLGNPIPEYMTSNAAWENTLRLIFALPPQTYRLTPEAYDAYREFQAWYEEAKQDERIVDSGPEYMTAFGKLEGLVGRFILLFHLVEQPFSPAVGPEVVHRVVSLIRGYVIPAYRYALGEVAGVINDEFEQWMIDYIIQISSDTQVVDLRGLKRSARRKLEGKTDWQKDQMVLDAMYSLEQAGWVIQVEAEVHKHKVTWAINPGLPSMFKGYRERVIKAKQRHADYIYRYAYEKGYERKVVKGYDPDTMDE